MKTLTGDHWKIHVGDVMDGLALVPDKSVHCVVTSPPYWQLRDYGYEGQIGLEATPDKFVESMVKVFSQVWRAMRDDGVLFLNLGDSYAAQKSGTKMPAQTVSGGVSGFGDINAMRGMPTAEINPRRDSSAYGLTGGNMIGIPWKVAFALQSVGWVLRKDIIWAKPSPMPESVSGWRWVACRKKECSGCDACESTDGYVLRRGSWRPTTSHEMIFMFVKSPKYFCDGDGSKEAASGTAHARGKGVNPKSESIELTSSRIGQPKQNASFSAAVNGIVETRNMRSVWRISSESYKEAHFATYPTELVRRCLIAGTSRGGCCSACGSQYAPVVESHRMATRPGTNSKVNRASDDMESPYHKHSGDVVGNRDPQRHTTTTIVTGYLPTCSCNSAGGRPIVLDPFGGSMTTGQVAINMGCDFIGLEGNPDYAELGVQRINTPWVPVSERKSKSKKKRIKKHKRQIEMFSD